MLTRYIGITGMKKAGKTTTIENLVPKLNKLGYKVGTVKIAFKEVSIDINNEHYDVVRHRKIKPEKTLFKSSIETTIFVNDNLTLREALSEFGKGLDIVLLEGFKENLVGIPQIVVLKENDQEEDFSDEYTVAFTSIPEFDIKSKDKRFIKFDLLEKTVEEKALPLFPELDCKHCGYDSCKDLIQAIIKGDKNVTDCFVLETEISDLLLKVNDKIVPCNPFVRAILKNVVLGVIKAIKIEDEDLSEIDLKILLSKEDREELNKNE